MYGFEVPITDARLKTLLMDLDGKMPARMNKALEILSTTPEKKVVDGVLKELKKTNKTIKMNAVIILGHKNDERVEGALIKVLREEKNEAIKRELCKALGNTGRSKEAIEALLELAGNGNTQLTVKAKVAIGKIRNRMNFLEERRDPAHIRKNEKLELVSMAEIKIAKQDVETRNRSFIERSGEMLEKMKELSRGKSRALKRAEKTFREMKRARA